MQIDSDVRGVTAFFGLDPIVLQAIVQVEGNIVEAVRRRYPEASIVTREEALKVVARCAVRAMSDWIRLGGEDRRCAFVHHWAKWWTFPGGAARWRNSVLREWTWISAAR
jgi:hypothetical protein